MSQVVGTVESPSELLAVLSGFRRGFYDCLSARADALFELTDAVACAGSPVIDLAWLFLEVEHRRGHGALYDGLNAGAVDTDRLRALVYWSVPDHYPRSSAPTGGRRSCWPWMFRTGYDRTRPPVRNAPSATPTPGAAGRRR
ncbi:transposase [Kocuria marina]|uniref:transposase n=1 Tax=Kocuria marina TaxID=223184 RepID=UPI0038CD3B5B